MLFSEFEKKKLANSKVCIPLLFHKQLKTENNKFPASSVMIAMQFLREKYCQLLAAQKPKIRAWLKQHQNSPRRLCFRFVIKYHHWSHNKLLLSKFWCQMYIWNENQFSGFELHRIGHLCKIHIYELSLSSIGWIPSNWIGWHHHAYLLLIKSSMVHAMAEVKSIYWPNQFQTARNSIRPMWMIHSFAVCNFYFSLFFICLNRCFHIHVFDIYWSGTLTFGQQQSTLMQQLA